MTKNFEKLKSCCQCIFKGTLAGLRYVLVIESSFNMMKNAFYFTSKAFFVLKIFKFLSWCFGQLANRLN